MTFGDPLMALDWHAVGRGRTLPLAGAAERPTTPSAMKQPLPTHISHYEIRGVLGQGGMGTVYLALDPALRRQVALKVLRADTDDQRERFRREARIVARLQHPNIVAIYAVGEHDRQPFIAMEYIEGEPLSDGIRRRTPWSLHRKLQMAVDLCGGLAFAHRAGVVHRDVKPSNLMVSNGSGTLRLLDFGIARGVDGAATMDLTMLGNIVGTLNYMSPEQITGQTLDHRSDIFAVGLVLYELLAYRQAFPGDNLATLTYRIVHGSAEPLRELQPDLDPELCAVVERAMARLPDDRYPHLEAMRTDLVRVAARLSPEAAALLATQGVAGTTPASGQPLIWSHALDPTVAASGPATPRSTARVPDPAATEEDVTPTGGRRWPMAAGAGGLVLAAVAAMWLAVGRDATSPSMPSSPGPVTTQVPPTRETNGPTIEASAPTNPPVPPPAAAPRTSSPVTVPPVGAKPSPSANRTAKGAETSRPPASQGTESSEREGRPAGGTVPTRGQALPEQPMAPPAIINPVPEDPAPGGRPAGNGGLTVPVSQPAEPVAAGPSDEDLVQAALTQWASAYTARDARGVNAVQPGSEGELEKQFGQLQSVGLSLSGCRITVQQARATADCAEHFTAQLKVGGRRQDDTRRRQFTLDKSSGAWRITSARIAR
jgi:serine/threonine-protein kinase